WLQAVAACGPGRKKSRPDRAADGASCCSNSRMEMRCPSVAVATGSLLPPQPNGRALRTVPHEATVRARPLNRATLRVLVMVGVPRESNQGAGVAAGA